MFLSRVIGWQQCMYFPAKLIELFGNRTQSNPTELNRTIGFGNRTKSNQKDCVRVQLGLVFEPNRTQSNFIEQ